MCAKIGCNLGITIQMSSSSYLMKAWKTASPVSFSCFGHGNYFRIAWMYSAFLTYHPNCPCAVRQGEKMDLYSIWNRWAGPWSSLKLHASVYTQVLGCSSVLQASFHSSHLSTAVLETMANENKGNFSVKASLCMTSEESSWGFHYVIPCKVSTECESTQECYHYENDQVCRAKCSTKCGFPVFQKPPLPALAFANLYKVIQWTKCTKQCNVYNATVPRSRRTLLR